MMKRRPQTVGDMIPAFVSILLAFLQLLLFLAIIGLEAGSVYYDAGRGTVFAGFWCGLIFLVTWIAMFSYTCCKRSLGCGIYLVLQNIFSAIFASVLIAFTARFIDDPCRCYGLFCKIPSWDIFSNDGYPSIRYGCTPRTVKKLPLLKGLLSCAVLMLVLNLIFIVVYIISYILLRKNRTSANQTQSVYKPSYQSSPVMNSAGVYGPAALATTSSGRHDYDSSVWTEPTMEMPNTANEILTMKF